MALPVQHTFSRNISMEAILAGKYDNIRIHGIAGNMNPDLDWTTLKNAVANASKDMVQDWYGVSCFSCFSRFSCFFLFFLFFFFLC